jgi:hypothetical protein
MNKKQTIQVLDKLQKVINTSYDNRELTKAILYAYWIGKNIDKLEE